MFRCSLKNIWRVLVVPVLLLSFTSCSDDDDGGRNVNAPREHQFVWEGLNLWYYWLNDVPNLADNIPADAQQYENLLNSANDPEQLFYSLLNDYPVTDRFSFIVDDYVALDNAIQGITKSFGMEFGLIRISSFYSDPDYGVNDVLGYVEYVVPGSPADQAGLVRGDLFTKQNGVQITVNNFRDLLFGVDNYSLTLADISGDDITEQAGSVSLTSVEITENPVFLSKVIDLPGIKVGYLVFNAFIATYHSELNAVFADFAAAGVDEVVLDLRYNGGGSVLTAQYLSSMIHDGPTTDVFGNITYNSKIGPQSNTSLNFEDELSLVDADFNQIGTETINRLDLSRVFILTTGNTASASELVINAVEPFMDVILIGETTVGKNVGSLTLYDAPGSSYREKTQANPSHRWALQPIISIFSNSVNQSDYQNGFVPDVVISEANLLEDLKPLGDVDEAYLAEALSQICPTCRQVGAELKGPARGEVVGGSQLEERFGQEMYLNGILD